MKEIKRISVMSMAKINALIMGTFGLIFGIIFAVADGMSPLGAGQVPIPASSRIAMVIILPLVYLAAGAVMGALSAVIYNFFARKVGGLKIELK